MKKLSLMKKISLEECNSRSITDLFFAVLFCYDTKTACVTILLDLGEEYVSVAANGANGKFLDNPKLIIACMEPFGEYTKKENTVLLWMEKIQLLILMILPQQKNFLTNISTMN